MKFPISFLLGAFMLCAQSQPPNASGNPNNSGYDHLPDVNPDSRQTLELCAFYKLSNGVELGVALVPFVLFGSTTTASGWHAHEASLNQRDRPQGQFVGGAQSYQSPASATSTGTVAYFTGPDGCYQFTVQYPGIAGWYTWEAHFPPVTTNGVTRVFPAAGVNVYARYYGTAMDPRIAPTGQQYLQPEDSDPYIRSTQQLSDRGHNGNSRNVEPKIIDNIEAATYHYFADSYAQLGIGDRVNIARASLPDGGLADNELFFSTAGSNPAYNLGIEDWTADNFEEHAHGTEIDIGHSAFETAQGSEVNGYDLLMLQDFTEQFCNVGQYLPGQAGTGTAVSFGEAVKFWLQAPYMHLVCGASPLEFTIVHGGH